MRARVRTTGIIETCFVIDNLRYRLCDVGGQVSERRKWINTFEGVNVLLFVVAISEYDEVLLEDPSASKLQESMNLFENISNSLWFRKNTTMILLLNKVDLLRQKLPRSSLKVSRVSRLFSFDSQLTHIRLFLGLLSKLSRRW